MIERGLEDMAKVIIDAAHGGNDTGDIYQNRLEKDDDLKLALAIGDRLKNQYGFDVVYTRTSDSYLSQLDRIKIANSEGGDLYMSVHRIIGELPSETPGLGFYIYKEGGLAETVANNIGKSLETSFPTYSISVRTDLPLFRNVTMPILSIGIGNLNSDTDNLLFDTHFNEIADAISAGIVESFSDASEKKLNTSELNYNRNGSIEQTVCYRVQLGAFSVYENALNLQIKLMQMGYPAVIGRRMNFYVVQIGDFTNLDDAAVWENCLRMQGYDTFMITV